jgi:hypothetical protein
MFLIFLILIMNIWEEFKVLSRFIQKCTQPPACWDHSLFRILSSYWLLLFLVCSTLVWIVDCWFSSNIHSRAVIQRAIVVLTRIFGARFVHIQPVIPTRRMIRGIFVWRGSEFWSLIKYSRSKLKSKTYSGWCPFKVLSNDTTLRLNQSGRPVPLSFKGTVAWDRFRQYCQKLTDVGLNKGRGWFLNFSEAPLIFSWNKTSSLR